MEQDQNQPQEEVSRFDPPQEHRPRREFLESRRAKLFVGLIALALLTLVAGSYFVFGTNRSQTPIEQSAGEVSDDQPADDPTTIRMLATGDFIAHDSVNEQAKSADGNYDYLQFMTAMKPFFDDSDINFCNQATLAAGGEFGIGGYPVFNAPLQWTRDMRGLGCNLINTGTNHTNDKGQDAINAMLKEWDTQEDILAVAGANRTAEEQQTVKYFTVKGVKFAFLSYSTYSNAPNPTPHSLNRFEEPLVTNQMTAAREEADVVIVSMRWGTEYSSAINSTQDFDAKKLVDLGADIILGHGPHVLQPVKRLEGRDGRETIAWFSLGNFINTQLETEALTGCVAQFTIDTATKKLTDSTCLPFYMHYEWTAEQAAAEDLLSRRNLQILPLYSAQELMSQSNLGTTVEVQMDRIRKIVNSYTEITVSSRESL